MAESLYQVGGVAICWHLNATAVTANIGEGGVILLHSYDIYQSEVMFFKVIPKSLQPHTTEWIRGASSTTVNTLEVLKRII